MKHNTIPTDGTTVNYVTVIENNIINKKKNEK